MDSFISRFEKGDIGWSYKETKDGSSQLTMRDGQTPIILESTNAHAVVEKEQDRLRFSDIMKSIFGRRSSF
ncbi:Uncharacterised protein [uncultured archaeon]|nr:Uncharacterised protein [uncultured archaeon]